MRRVLVREKVGLSARTHRGRIAGAGSGKQRRSVWILGLAHSWCLELDFEARALRGFALQPQTGVATMFGDAKDFGGVHAQSDTPPEAGHQGRVLGWLGAIDRLVGCGDLACNPPGQ